MSRSIALIWILVAFIVAAEEPAPAKNLGEAAKGLPDKLQGKPLAFVPLIAEPPKELKGDLSDPVWQKASTLKFATNNTGDEVKFPTSAKVFCSKEAFYLGVQFEDPDVDNAKTDGEIWERDGLEFLIFPGEDLRQKLYYQVILDSKNQHQCFYTHIYPKHNNHCQSGQWTPSLQSAVAKSKTGWTAELRIAFSDLSVPKNVEEGKSLFRMAVYRNRAPRGGDKIQNYAWSPTLADSYHCSWKFGYALVEAYATEELIKQIIERKKKEGETTNAASVADAVKNEIKALVEKLGHDNYQERSTAHEKLAAMTTNDRGAELYAEELLRTAERETDDAEIRSRARKLLAGIRERKNPDEDPLPGYQRFVGPQEAIQMGL
ncbi:MAG TPA: sugar-binding protein [Planctomycetota bacterium]|nr:sugar-binding protein [Planctomycetota bacterium]